MKLALRKRSIPLGSTSSQRANTRWNHPPVDVIRPEESGAASQDKPGDFCALAEVRGLA